MKPKSERLSCNDYYKGIKIVTPLHKIKVGTVLYCHRLGIHLCIHHVQYEQRGVRKHTIGFNYYPSTFIEELVVDDVIINKADPPLTKFRVRSVFFIDDSTSYHLGPEEAKRCYIVRDNFEEKT